MQSDLEDWSFGKVQCCIESLFVDLWEFRALEKLMLK